MKTTLARWFRWTDDARFLAQLVLMVPGMTVLIFALIICVTGISEVSHGRAQIGGMLVMAMMYCAGMGTILGSVFVPAGPRHYKLITGFLWLGAFCVTFCAAVAFNERFPAVQSREIREIVLMVATGPVIVALWNIIRLKPPLRGESREGTSSGD